MRDKKTLRNITLALCAFILWGNLVSLLLPAEEYAAVIKTVDFATAVFLLALLTAAVAEIRRQRGRAGDKKLKK